MELIQEIIIIFTISFKTKGKKGQRKHDLLVSQKKGFRVRWWMQSQAWRAILLTVFVLGRPFSQTQGSLVWNENSWYRPHGGWKWMLGYSELFGMRPSGCVSDRSSHSEEEACYWRQPWLVGPQGRAGPDQHRAAWTAFWVEVTILCLSLLLLTDGYPLCPFPSTAGVFKKASCFWWLWREAESLISLKSVYLFAWSSLGHSTGIMGESKIGLYHVSFCLYHLIYFSRCIIVGVGKSRPSVNFTSDLIAPIWEGLGVLSIVWPGTNNRYSSHTCLCAKRLQTCPTLCDPMDCVLPGSSVHGILQARILEWIVMPSFRGSSQPRDQIWIGRQVNTSSYLGNPFLS